MFSCSHPQPQGRHQPPTTYAQGGKTEGCVGELEREDRKGEGGIDHQLIGHERVGDPREVLKALILLRHGLPVEEIEAVEVVEKDNTRLQDATDGKVRAHATGTFSRLQKMQTHHQQELLLASAPDPQSVSAETAWRNHTSWHRVMIDGTGRIAGRKQTAHNKQRCVLPETRAFLATNVTYAFQAKNVFPEPSISCLRANHRVLKELITTKRNTCKAHHHRISVLVWARCSSACIEHQLLMSKFPCVASCRYKIRY
eukprot:549669-Rhodomonas_salina.1